MENYQYYLDKAVDVVTSFGSRFLLAIITMLVGLRLIKIIRKYVNLGLKTARTDKSLTGFLVSLLDWTLKVLLFISVASMLGVETTSFIALLGAAGLAVGLALQGTLANFAGGVLILAFKPYKVGDLVEIQGHFGEVESIEIFVSKIVTPEHKTVVIPNGPIANGNIINYSEKGKIRVDLVVGVSYESDLKRTKQILMQALLTDERVMRDPVPTVAVLELADSSVNFAVRPWCNPLVYWDVYFTSLENCKIALDNAGIAIPFPQRDVHVIPQKN